MRCSRRIFSIAALVTMVMASASFSGSALADNSSDQFCRRTSDDIFKLANDPDQRIAFPNYGGLFGGGVCWWHSRMQRSALYLALFRPDLAKPSAKEAKSIVRELARMKHVVTIPGYSNFHDFTADFEKVVEKRLETWQVLDGLFHAAWIDGLSGKPRVSPSRLEAMMDRLYVQLQTSHQIILEKLQIPGITAHAWLVLDMRPTESGYELSVIDSNMPGDTVTIDYARGDTQLVLPYGFTFVPYVDYAKDMRKIGKALTRYCGHAPF